MFFPRPQIKYHKAETSVEHQRLRRHDSFSPDLDAGPSFKEIEHLFRDAADMTDNGKLHIPTSPLSTASAQHFSNIAGMRGEEGSPRSCSSSVAVLDTDYVVEHTSESKSKSKSRKSRSPKSAACAPPGTTPPIVATAFASGRMIPSNSPFGKFEKDGHFPISETRACDPKGDEWRLKHCFCSWSECKKTVWRLFDGKKDLAREDRGRPE
jgi:hypothetical protein